MQNNLTSCAWATEEHIRFWWYSVTLCWV